MDKKQLTIVSILGALIVALVFYVIFALESETRLTKNQVLRIENSIYELAELEKYMHIYNESTGDITKVLSEEEKEAIFEACKLLNMKERDLINNKYEIVTFKQDSIQTEVIAINNSVLE